MRTRTSDRARSVQRVILVEGLGNTAILLCKAWVGFATGSLAVLTDAVHSLADIANNVIAWIVLKVSSRPADASHPYGHRKFEVLAVFALATLLAVMSVEIALAAIRREAPSVRPDALGLVLMLGVLVVNVLLASWERVKARQLESPILQADSDHTFADVMTTIAVIAGWQVSAAGYLWVDTVVSLAVAVFVLWLALGLYRKSLPALVDQVALPREQVVDAIADLADVARVGRVRSRWIGADIAIDLEVEVDPGMTTEEAHRVADQIEALLEAELNASDVTVHIEPHASESR